MKTLRKLTKWTTISFSVSPQMTGRTVYVLKEDLAISVTVTSHPHPIDITDAYITIQAKNTGIGLINKYNISK